MLESGGEMHNRDGENTLKKKSGMERMSGILHAAQAQDSRGVVLGRESVSRAAVWILLVFIGLLLPSCRERSVPKEYGYFRIELPPHSYRLMEDKKYPYSFLVAEAAEVEAVEHESERYWIDIRYPAHNAVVHCSYKPVRHNLNALTDDAMEFVFSHAVKASAIPEQAYSHPEERVYGLVFNLEGNAATPMQFFLTDSVHHFFRGALYFNNIPNQDSLAPVANFIREDMTVLIESFKWKP